MITATPKLNARQERALSALLTSPTIKDAATVARLSETTLHRYLRDEVFAASYRTARRETVAHLTTRLQADSSSMAQVLKDIAEDTSAPASARVTAARSVIDFTLKSVELEDLAERIGALEEMIGKGER